MGCMGSMECTKLLVIHSAKPWVRVKFTGVCEELFNASRKFVYLD